MAVNDLKPQKVHICMLGGFSMQIDDVIVSENLNRSHKIWNLLAYLIMSRNRNVPQSELIQVLWPEEDSSNPSSALKTLLHRTRNLLAPYFSKNLQLIRSTRGAYAWNAELDCSVDTEEFELLCHRAEDFQLNDKQKMKLYSDAVSLYKGDFLPLLEEQIWVISLSSHYHALYLKTVKAYAELLERAGLYAEMADVCTTAIQIDTFDEELHTLLIQALLRQGKNTAALSHYETTTDLLYRNLGVRPSEDLRNLYLEIMKEQKNLETDLGVIQANLQEVAARSGAFICEYGFFKEAYRLEVRRAMRQGLSIHIGLITISRPNGDIPELEILDNAMRKLLNIFQSTLRRGDVVSRYSGAQYVLMLPGANYENAVVIMDRIVNTFYRQNRKAFLKVNYKLEQMDLYSVAGKN